MSLRHVSSNATRVGNGDDVLLVICDPTGRNTDDFLARNISKWKMPGNRDEITIRALVVRLRLSILLIIQGDPHQFISFQIAVALKLSTSDPMLVKPKCV